MIARPSVKLWRAWLDHPSTLTKQVPSVVALAAAIVLIAWFPDLHLSSVGSAAVGAALIGVATVVAVALMKWSQPYHWLVLAIPTLDIIGFGFFRAGTGGAGSLFSSFILLPIVWLAAAPGWLPIALVGVLSSVMMLYPNLSGGATGASEWMRGIVAPVVFASVAGIVNQLARQQRRLTRKSERLSASRSRALASKDETLERLRASEQNYRKLAETFRSVWASITEQAVIAVEENGRVIAWNPGAVRLFGRSEAEAVSYANLTEVLPASLLRELATQEELSAHDVTTASQRAEVASQSIAEVKRAGLRVLFAAADEGSFEREFQLRSGGTLLPARLTAATRYDDCGQRVGYLIVITDETRAAEVGRLKDEFIGMVTHELRTPLSSIVGFADLMRTDPDHVLTPEQDGFLAVIERNTKRLLKVVGDLLLTAQVGAGRFPVERAVTDLAVLVRDAAESAAPAAERAGIEIETSVPPGPVMLSIDVARLGQAVDNLLSNAIKFSRPGGRVSLTVEVGAEAFIRVRDRGVGIPEGERGQMFDRFFRATTATQNAIPGVGLGLVITRAIVLAHQGKLTFENFPDEGTEFCIALPMLPDAAGSSTLSGIIELP